MLVASSWTTKSPPHLLTLVLLAGTAPLAMNIILPSMPSISAEMGTDKSLTQLAITLYLITTAIIQPFIGPASDYYGRRPLILFGLACFFIGTLITIAAPNLPVLLMGRVIQALATTALVISRAVIRDIVDTEIQAATMIAYVTMGMAVAPMVGPLMGGYLDQAYGWRASFWLILVFGILVSILVWRDLGETRKEAAKDLTSQFKTYPELLRSRRFWGASMVAAFCSSSFFAFLGGAPYVADEFFQLDPSQFGAYFTILPVGYFLGNFISGRFTKRFGVTNMMMAGNIVLAVGVTISMLLTLYGLSHPLTFFGPIAFMGVGNGMTLPSANAGIVNARPQFAGAASGLGGFLQISVGSAVSALAGFVLGQGSHPMPLYLLMLVTALIGMLATAYVFYVEHDLKKASQAE